MADFDRALMEVQPAFGLEKDELELLYSNGMVPFSEEWKAMQDKLAAMINQVFNSGKGWRWLGSHLRQDSFANRLLEWSCWYVLE